MIELEQLSLEELKRKLNYDQETGIFTWLMRTSSRAGPGQVAGSMHPDGTILIRIKGARYKAHHLAWFYVHGKWPEYEVRHCNRNAGDNRIKNLEERPPLEKDGGLFTSLLDGGKHQVTRGRGGPATCHPGRKSQSRGMCQPCYKEWLRTTRPEDRPKYTAGGRGVYSPRASCHPDRPHRSSGLCQECYLKEYQDKNSERLKEVQRGRHFMVNYGLTLADVERILEEQNGRCAICNAEPAEGKKLHVDHCHTTGVVRGMLCYMCNYYLGYVDRDPEILDRMRSYREAHV